MNDSDGDTDHSSPGKFHESVTQDINQIDHLILDYHLDSINSITFAKTSRYHLVSGGADKTIMIWKINDETFTQEKSKIIKTQSDITDIAITSNDKFLLCASVDNNIYVYQTNFLQNQHTFYANICIHNNFITSICLQPIPDMNMQSIKFASYADDGRLILAELILGVKTNVIKDYKGLVNTTNKIISIQKKIEYVL